MSAASTLEEVDCAQTEYVGYEMGYEGTTAQGANFFADADREFAFDAGYFDALSDY